ncbi:endonuclease-reverse transcriptase [Elysia marginata]|uniref:Endonuclease-reverse transcriptase n=1 Tax=Elysia marginata TaxID=1093978 RepID=A0AAV4FHJ6_9GAST|nr:endonuclease-reverse transcriptase [Elysia marginata]
MGHLALQVRGVERLTTSHVKINYVTETEESKNHLHLLGDDRASSKPKGNYWSDLSTFCQVPPDRLVERDRIMYESGKTAQVVKEMHRCRLHILVISETHWNQSGQKTLGTENC